MINDAARMLFAVARNLLSFEHAQGFPEVIELLKRRRILYANNCLFESGPVEGSFTISSCTDIRNAYAVFCDATDYRPEGENSLLITTTERYRDTKTGAEISPTVQRVFHSPEELESFYKANDRGYHNLHWRITSRL